jgi:hypothetical protein
MCRGNTYTAGDGTPKDDGHLDGSRWRVHALLANGLGGCHVMGREHRRCDEFYSLVLYEVAEGGKPLKGEGM